MEKNSIWTLSVQIHEDLQLPHELEKTTSWNTKGREFSPLLGQICLLKLNADTGPQSLILNPEIH